MTYLHFINFFNQYDREQRFSDGASRLYIKLLDVANEINRNRPKGAPWIVDFQRSDGYVAGVYGCAVNTVKRHRDELVKRGLVSGDFGQSGRNAGGKYHLFHPEENVSKVDTLPGVNLSSVDTFSGLIVSTLDTINSKNPLNVSTNVSTVDTLYIEEEKEESSTASADTPSLSFSVEKSEKPKPAASKKKPAAHADEVAALALPHLGPQFGELWAEFRAMPKQVKKPVTSLRRLLVTLGKYAEGFAQLMLEKAIEGNWSGVEYESTPKAYAEWRAAEAARAYRQPVRTSSPDGDGPEPNQEFLDEVAARKQKEIDDHLARYSLPSVVVDPNKAFGYDQSAAEGLAQARATPEYQQYLAEQAAEKTKADSDAKPRPPDPPSENPADSAQEQA